MQKWNWNSQYVEPSGSHNSNVDTDGNLEEGPELRRGGKEQGKPQYLQDYVTE